MGEIKVPMVVVLKDTKMKNYPVALHLVEKIEGAASISGLSSEKKVSYKDAWGCDYPEDVISSNYKEFSLPHSVILKPEFLKDKDNILPESLNIDGMVEIDMISDIPEIPSKRKSVFVTYICSGRTCTWDIDLVAERYII